MRRGSGGLSLSTLRFSRSGSSPGLDRRRLSLGTVSRELGPRGGSLRSPAPPPLSSPSSRPREWERRCLPHDLCRATTRSLHPQWLQGTRPAAAALPGRVAALPLPTPPVITEQQAGLPVLSSTFPPAVYYTESVYMSGLLSPFTPLSPSPTVFTSPFSMSMSPFLPCK